MGTFCPGFRLDSCLFYLGDLFVGVCVPTLFTLLFHVCVCVYGGVCVHILFTFLFHVDVGVCVHTLFTLLFVSEK